MKRRWIAWLCAVSLFGTMAAVVPVDMQTIVARASGFFEGNYTTIRYGESGERVLQLQQALTALNFFHGTMDAKFGNVTLESVKAFQTAYGLNADGAAGQQTLQKIEERLTDANALVWHTLQELPSQPTAVPTPAPTRMFQDGWVIPSQTLRKGATGVEVYSVQARLSQLGYYQRELSGYYDDVTITAVTNFQRANGLTADGLTGKQTSALLFSNGARAAEAGALSDVALTPSRTQATATPAPVQPTATSYTTLRSGAKGAEVTRLQTALASLGYAVSVTGTYDSATIAAVKAFQKQNGLSVDGIAGPLTQGKLYSGSAATPTPAPAPQVSTTTRVKYGGAPDGSNLYLLHWFNEVRPSIKNGQTCLVYDPATGISWTLRFYSLGRHADSEPLSASDTAQMVRAFGGENTWNQKAVYVRLPDGRWTVASTHDMPHLNGSISDNNFNGHLCVHFLRDMDECKKNDPSYGVSNQNTIRAKWNAITGETIP